jgi:hypothetical protein
MQFFLNRVIKEVVFYVYSIHNIVVKGHFSISIASMRSQDGALEIEYSNILAIDVQIPKWKFLLSP